MPINVPNSGNPVNEGFGTVDGIENPAEAIAAGYVGKLFPQHAVVRELLGKHLPHQLLGPLIGDGDWRFVRFGFHQQAINLIMLKNQLGGASRHVERELQTVGITRHRNSLLSESDFSEARHCFDYSSVSKPSNANFLGFSLIQLTAETRRQCIHSADQK
jgi:hypothetical protein